MSADLSDPAIFARYQEIISFTSPTNWLLLTYGQSRDKLKISATGEGGVEEIRPRLQGDVFFSLLREERSFILISFVPEDISGVRRARALVHSRAVGSLFKAHHAAWTITKPAMLTEEAVRSRLKLQPSTDSQTSLPSAQSPITPANKLHVDTTPENKIQAIPATPESIATPLASPQPRRVTSPTANGTVPKGLPTPPPSRIPVVPRNPTQQTAPPISPTTSMLNVPHTNGPPRTAAQEEAAQSRAKWALENENERRVLQRQRSRLEMQREAEAEQQALFDAERSARLKFEREEAMRLEMDADDRRKASEQEQARRLAAERVAEEQRRRDEIGAKKAMEAQRRREEVAVRIRREKEEQIERERLASEKQRQEEEKLSGKRLLHEQFTNLRSTGAIMLTGNVTTQKHDSIYWRRRYFELSDAGLAFYKSSDTTANRLDLLPLSSKVRAITEKHDELQSIPCSFAIDFKDDTIQLFFCDTQEDKEVLTSAIMEVSNL